MQSTLHEAGSPDPRDAVLGPPTPTVTFSLNMPEITKTTLPNDLPLYRIPLPGTRALTILLAFDAGARTESADENGMAHFLEHLVFKGGQKYATYRDVNEAAERIGGVLNAYTSHDLVAFHITARAEQAAKAIDLLTDFVNRPRIDSDELDRERGVVVQEIARANDQPAALAEHLIDEATFGEHPLGRPVLGTVEHIRDTFTRDAILSFRSRRWAPPDGAAFVAGNLQALPREEELYELFGRLEPRPSPRPYDPAPPFHERVLVRERDSNQSHLRLAYRPAVDTSDPRKRAALQVYSTVLGGSMGSRLFDEIREQRGLAYSVYSAAHAHSDTPVLALAAGLQSSKCLEALARMKEIVTELREEGPKEAEVQRARAYAAGARTIAFENSGAVARHAAQQTIVYGEDPNPDTVIKLLDQVTSQDVRKVAAAIPEKLSLACVGPHTVDELQSV